jgi:membrane fusion protein
MGAPLRRPLFRHEVIEFEQHNRQWGRVAPLQPRWSRLTVWFMTSAVAAVIAFLFCAHYARKETAAGYLTPASGTARIFAPQPGTVSAIYVEQGQPVEEGQPLLTVTTSQIATSGEDVNAKVLNTLEQQKQSLTLQIATEVRRTASERKRLAAQMQELETEVSHLSAQIAVQRERILLLERVAENGTQLSLKGLVSQVDQRRREESLLEQRQALISLNQQLTAREGQLTEIRFNDEQLPFTQAERVQRLRNEIAAAEQRVAEVNGRLAYVIRAPIAGRISSLQASVGQLANPQRLQLQIVPENSPLQAELFVPTRAIGSVEVGQDVRILYDAFPYQHFGTYRGRIIKVSKTVLTSSDVATPITLKEPAYKATVALDQPYINAYSKRIPLQPDMLLRADIILERRTLVDWILDPLLSTRIQG